MVVASHLSEHTENHCIVLFKSEVYGLSIISERKKPLVGNEVYPLSQQTRILCSFQAGLATEAQA